MRSSDRKKSVLESSHDRQIGESAHDRIVLWMYRQAARKEIASLLTGVPASKIVEIERTLERPLSRNRYGGHNDVVGFADLAVKVSWNEKDDGGDYRETRFGFVEVKSSVNVGETIRQIRYYQSADDGKGKWSVCAPKFPDSDVLVEQGIGFIEYETEDFY